MKNWINNIKSIFNKQPNDTHGNNKKGKSEVSGFVRERMKFYEELQANNSEPTLPDRTDAILRQSKGSCYIQKPDVPKSNIELTPSVVKNKDNICVYHGDGDVVYGSFKKRPNFTNHDSMENEVKMRLKVQEDEHLGVHRYKSILKAPLSQHLILSKYNDGSLNPEYELSNTVSSKIDKHNQDFFANKKQEQVFDIDLLNSICKRKTLSLLPEKPKNTLQLLDGNKPLRWANTDRVKSANILKKMTKQDIHFQESQFELIATEASYYQSLNVLVDKFYHSPLLSVNNKGNTADKCHHIKAHQKEHLFSNILQIHSISGRFLADLEKRFSESIIMKDVCDIVTRHAKNHFKEYVPYLQNQKFQTEAYNKLKTDEKTAKVIEELESQPECCGLSLDSFLLLPMQRLLRIKLMLSGIKNNVPKGNILATDSVDIALAAVENVINLSNTKKGQMDERQRMIEIVSSLTAKPGNNIPTISSGTLLHEGEVKCHRKSSGMRSIRLPVYDAWIILTNEYFLITKINKNKKQSYVVEDICGISEIEIEELSTDKENRAYICHQFSVIFNKTNTYIIQTKSSDDYSKWIKELAICPKKKISNTK